MPQLGETVTEGTVTKWLKSVGEQVARDEPLFEVSTDKVDSEVPSPAEGVLSEIIVQEGDTVDVGERLAVINGDGAGSASAPAATEAPAPPSESPAPAPPAAAAPAAPSPAPAPAPAAPVASAPSAPEAVAIATESPSVSSGNGQVLSPVVRKLMNENGIDPSQVTGTGLGNRITRDDVEAVIAGRSGTQTAPAPAAPAPAAQAPAPAAPAPAAQAPAAPAPAAPAPAAPSAPPLATQAPSRADGRDEVVPFTNIRRRTAEHMVRSKATSPHTLMVKEADYERVEQVRRAHGERFKSEEGFSLSYLPFAARAAVEALGVYPHLNSSVGEDALIVHHDVNLGVAVDLDNEGLIVPVVHHAEELTLRGMARRIRDLADRARTKRLSADDISGGTFSITNAGPFGTLLTGAIINQPQVAILSTDGVSRRPVVVQLPDGSESIAIHSMGLLAMTFDHRAVDGAYVARFLARMSEILVERDWASEL
jgi:pyruvate dehydrogenase E2 component (dihydrolipoamide acetyltransferase)